MICLHRTHAEYKYGSRTNAPTEGNPIMATRASPDFMTSKPSPGPPLPFGGSSSCAKYRDRLARSKHRWCIVALFTCVLLISWWRILINEQAEIYNSQAQCPWSSQVTPFLMLCAKMWLQSVEKWNYSVSTKLLQKRYNNGRKWQQFYIIQQGAFKVRVEVTKSSSSKRGWQRRKGQVQNSALIECKAMDYALWNNCKNYQKFSFAAALSIFQLNVASVVLAFRTKISSKVFAVFSSVLQAGFSSRVMEPLCDLFVEFRFLLIYEGMPAKTKQYSRRLDIDSFAPVIVFVASYLQ